MGKIEVIAVPAGGFAKRCSHSAMTGNWDWFRWWNGLQIVRFNGMQRDKLRASAVWHSFGRVIKSEMSRYEVTARKQTAAANQREILNLIILYSISSLSLANANVAQPYFGMRRVNVILERFEANEFIMAKLLCEAPC